MRFSHFGIINYATTVIILSLRGGAFAPSYRTAAIITVSSLRGYRRGRCDRHARRGL